MKTVIRNAMVVACMGLLLWGGVAVPAEPPPVPESCEYLMDAIECYPLPQHGRSPVAGIVASDQLDAAIWFASGSPEVVTAVALPEAGTWEHSMAMETGNLPSVCADEPCPTEEFTLIEAGGIVYRLEVDCGGN